MRPTLAVLAVLIASPAFTQTPAPAVPTRAKVHVLPAASDTPVAERETLIAVDSAACNLEPFTEPPPPLLVNPTMVYFADPFHAGRDCRVPMPTNIPDGQGYRGAASFYFDACGTSGQPCSSSRTLGAPPFSIVSPLLPFAPTAVRTTQ